MNKIVIYLMTILILVGGCSPNPDDKSKSEQPISEIDSPVGKLPIAKNLNEQATQLQNSNKELQALLKQWEAQQ